jgi:hypothetical protein
VYGGNGSFLLPRALRINGEVVYTPAGVRYEIVGGGRDEPLLLQLTIMPTSLKFLPGNPPPTSQEVTSDDTAAA